MSAQLAQALRNLMKAYPTSSSLAQTDAHIAAQAALAGFEAAPQQEPSQASTYEPDPAHDNRYRVEQQGFWWWVIRAGDGTRTLFKAHTKISAMELAQELATAFRDGEFVGQSEKAQQAQAPGWQLVPVEPTPEMESECMGLLMCESLVYERPHGGLSVETIAPVKLWAAMLKAAPQQGSNT